MATTDEPLRRHSFAVCYVPVIRAYPPLTQKRDGLQHDTELLAGTLREAAFVAVAAEAVNPPQQPAALCSGFWVKLLQQLGGHSKVILEKRQERVRAPLYCDGQHSATCGMLTCFHALSAMCSFMLNLQSFISESTSSAPSTSMLSVAAELLSFSLILSRKKHLNQRHQTVTYLSRDEADGFERRLPLTAM